MYTVKRVAGIRYGGAAQGEPKSKNPWGELLKDFSGYGQAAQPDATGHMATIAASKATSSKAGGGNGLHYLAGGGVASTGSRRGGTGNDSR